jgi:hypothetical protein
MIQVKKTESGLHVSEKLLRMIHHTHSPNFIKEPIPIGRTGNVNHGGPMKKRVKELLSPVLLPISFF